MIKTGIVGVSGYSGIELFHILYLHPEVEITAISSRTYKEKKIGEIYPHLSHINIVCKEYSPDEIADLCDVVFTAVPHGGSAMNYAKSVKDKGKKLIDLSADFRLKNKNVYKEWYKVEHKYPELLKQAVYGLPEIYKEQIKNAWLIANPGCYTTAGILSLAPLLKKKIIDAKSIIIDAKSGVSGAGRKPKNNLHFPELDQGFCAYNLANHRHIPEIEQELSNFSEKEVKITFVPHLVPMVRGILSVSYANLKNKINENDSKNIFNEFYQDSPFVRILNNDLPNTKFVYGTNYVDIAIKIDNRTNKIIIISAIDNLIKGASGQAVQNMNIMFGLNETMGLDFKFIYP